MDFPRNMGVYTKVHKDMAKKDGCKTISARWIDTNKGDTDNPNFRSRLVGREIKTDSSLDLFSATPPLEVMKFLMSECAQSQDDKRGPMRLATIDIKRAYFYAPAQRSVYISIPVEDKMPGDENMVGKLNLGLLWTRDAAHNWASEYSGLLKKLGFVKCVASPCNCSQPERNTKLTVHGDDFLIVGSLKIASGSGSPWNKSTS